MGTQPDGTGEPAPGMGYANVDNLAFDVLANLWGVTDMTTGVHNAVGDGPTPSALPVNHSGVGSAADAGGNLVGVFGNNWMFFIPTFGPFAGVHFPFAIGPTRCEMTGPTFVGNTLVLSVQHPGEDSPTRAALAANPTFLRTGLEILTLDGSGVFPQDRHRSRRQPMAREHRQASNRHRPAGRDRHPAETAVMARALGARRRLTDATADRCSAELSTVVSERRCFGM